MFSLVIPVYKNEGSIPELLAAVEWIDLRLAKKLEVVFVVDGSPDRSHQTLEEKLATYHVKYQLILLSRNFGSFAAIRTGLKYASGKFFAVMAADLQEPKELIVQFFEALASGDWDVTIGTRRSRQDPFFSRVSSALFWGFYRRWIQKDIPEGGVDIFGCNTPFRDHLLELEESHSSLVGLIFWLGMRRKYFSYDRAERRHGRSAWTFKKKLKYLMDSLFSFSDFPIRLLLMVGGGGLGVSFILSVFVLLSRITGRIEVPGYTATALLILFFASLNSFGFGVLGIYVWRTYENTKGRPESIVQGVRI